MSAVQSSIDDRLINRKRLELADDFPVFEIVRSPIIEWCHRNREID